MESVIFTPRLKLTLITKAERGSPELEWLHEIRSNEQTTFWSIRGRQQTLEETEDVIKGVLPAKDEEVRSYRVAYAVHKILHDSTDKTAEAGPQTLEGVDEQQQKPTEFIGVVNVASVGAKNLPLSKEFLLPVAAESGTLTIELAYQFLPAGWGQGFATESVKTLFEACKRGRTFWEPFSKVYVRAIVNSRNPPSMRVMEKVGMWRAPVFKWSGKAIYIGGEWRTEDDLYIYGKELMG